tara:strand:- start:34 stop:195 length:162 start_codon:yes stop_codon:yes gene_type:complete
MIYRGYDIEETPFSDGVTIYFNKEYIATADSIEEAQNFIDDEKLDEKLRKEQK